MLYYKQIAPLKTRLPFIYVLESLRQRIGVGEALINAVIQKAKNADCRRVWLITTNDNTLAIRFYQRFGDDENVIVCEYNKVSPFRQLL